MQATPEEMELTLLAMEARFLEAEATVLQAHLDELHWSDHLWATQNTPETNRLLRLMNRNLDACERLGFPYGVVRRAVTVEQSAYAWRRDYGEWPSDFNLADRHAQDVGISRTRARSVVMNAINEPSGRRQLHAIPGALMDYMLTCDEPQWDRPEVQAMARRLDQMRFYVAPPGLVKFSCEDVYSQGVRYLERMTS